MNTYLMIFMVLIMATITYLIRMIPLAFLRKKIKSTYICTFLYYIPYAVLSAMTFPYILYSTGNIISASIGCFVAIIASTCKRSLLTVAVLACSSVLIVNLIISLI